MNEVQMTFFQIKPLNEKWAGRYCQYMNDTFDLDDIRFISQVKTFEGIPMFFFEVEFSPYGEKSNKTMTYRFHAKSMALKAQRELSRALTKTGEFEHVKEKDTEAETS